MLEVDLVRSPLVAFLGPRLPPHSRKPADLVPRAVACLAVVSAQLRTVEVALNSGNGCGTTVGI